MWERTLRFRNQIVQDRIRTDVLAACVPQTTDDMGGGAGSNSYLMSQVVQCGTHDTISDTFPVANADGTTSSLTAATPRSSSGQGWVIELGRRIVAHSMRRNQQEGSNDDGSGNDVADAPNVSDVARRHVTYGGHDSGALIDNMPVKKATGDTSGKIGGSMWIKGPFDANATADDGSKCTLVNAPYDTDTGTKEPVESAASVTLKLEDGSAAAVSLDPADASYNAAGDSVAPGASAQYKLGTDEEYAAYAPNEIRMRPVMQENDQLCLSMQIKVRNSQNDGSSTPTGAERTAKVGFLFRQMAIGAMVPQQSSTGAAGTDLMSGAKNHNYQSGCSARRAALSYPRTTPPHHQHCRRQVPQGERHSVNLKHM